MGKYVSTKFDLNNPRIIDYASSSLRCDFMDIYLSAHCYLFITTSCGLDAIPYIFKKPTLVTNIPLFNFRCYFYYTIAIMKHIRDLKTNQLLSFTEIITRLSNLDRTNINQSLQKIDLCLMNNSSREILDAVIDILEQLNDNNQEHDQIDMNYYFWKNHMSAINAINKSIYLPQYNEVKMRIANSFLQNYQSLNT